MTRDEFMKELAYLLQDIQDEDKDDAVQSVSYTHLTLPTICSV